MQGLWFTEKQTPEVAISCRTKETLHIETTPYQELAILDTVAFGRMLTLDRVIQTTIRDEFVYHEMITHVALNTHPKPRRVLVIGGGDGGSVREIVKHPEVERVTLVEIDERVVAAAREYLPELSSGLSDPRVEVRFEDGIHHVAEHPEGYDLVVVDSTDPVGPAAGLFSAGFYRSIYRCLGADGILVAQTESPFFNRELIGQVQRELAAIFPVVRLFLANIPTYPGGLWTFSLASKRHDPLQADLTGRVFDGCRYYSPEIHRASFVLPPFVAQLLKE